MLVELIARTLAAGFLCGGTLAVSHAIAAELLPAAGLFTRGAAVAATGMALATLGFHLLAAAQLFTLPWALLAVLLLAALVLGPRDARRRWRAAVAHDLAAVRRLWRAVRRSPRRIWLLAFAVAGASVALRPFTMPPLGYDSLVYHSTKAAMWVHAGGLRFLHGIATHQVFRNFSAGGEVFTAWGMLPYHDDYLAAAPEAVQWLLLMVATVALARELGVREPFASAAAGLVASLPAIRLLVGSNYIEPPLALAFACGLVFFVRFLRRREPASLPLAAAGFGVAAATKLPMVALGVLALGLLLLAALLARRLRGSLAALVVFLALAAPWYVYNCIDTGRPLTPFPIRVAGVTLGESNWSFDRVRDYKRELVKPGDRKAEIASFEGLFLEDGRFEEAMTPYHLAILGVFLLTFPLALRRRPALFVPLGLLAAASVAMIYTRDMAPVRMIWPATFARFWIPAMLVVIPVSMLWCARWPRLARLWLALVVFVVLRELLRLAHASYTSIEVRGVSLLVVGGLLVWALVRTLPRRRNLHWIAAALFALIQFSRFHDWRRSYRYDLYLNSAVFGATPRSWVPLAQAIDHPGRAHRVAVTGAPMGTQPWFWYGLYGTRLQNDLFYLPVTAGGELVEDPVNLAKRGDPRVWLARVRASRAEYVVVLQENAVEIRWIRDRPEVFKPVYVEPAGRGVWRVDGVAVAAQPR